MRQVPVVSSRYCERIVAGSASGSPSGHSVEAEGQKNTEESARGCFSIDRMGHPFPRKFHLAAASPKLDSRVISPGSIFRHFEWLVEIYRLSVRSCPDGF